MCFHILVFSGIIWQKGQRNLYCRGGNLMIRMHYSAYYAYWMCMQVCSARQYLHWYFWNISNHLVRYILEKRVQWSECIIRPTMHTRYASMQCVTISPLPGDGGEIMRLGSIVSIMHTMKHYASVLRQLQSQEKSGSEIEDKIVWI